MNNLKTPQYWLQTTDSTMREAREVSQGNNFVLVSTIEQTTGRGTKGRSWLCGKGNIFMTVAIQIDLLGDPNLPLLPLNTGILLHEVYSRYLHRDFQDRIWIKWPNDILVETKKVSGVLMESDTNYLYVGIGINTAVAPVLCQILISSRHRQLI
jgi:BirA family biotin operon repressor/biotin-[acetyl-CoA-carboxylase] ligase